MVSISNDSIKDIRELASFTGQIPSDPGGKK
jgi:hypothetical protein